MVAFGGRKERAGSEGQRGNSTLSKTFYLYMGHRYDPMLATVNSWRREHKLLQTKQNTPKLLNWKFSEIRCCVNLVHFCLPHVWCSLSDFGADVGGKVTGTKSTAGLLTAGGQALDTHWHSSPTPPPPATGCRPLTVTGLNEPGFSWAHLTSPWGLGRPPTFSEPTSTLYLILESSSNETHKRKKKMALKGRRQ